MRGKAARSLCVFVRVSLWHVFLKKEGRFKRLREPKLFFSFGCTFLANEICHSFFVNFFPCATQQKNRRKGARSILLSQAEIVYLVHCLLTSGAKITQILITTTQCKLFVPKKSQTFFGRKTMKYDTFGNAAFFLLNPWKKIEAIFHSCWGLMPFFPFKPTPFFMHYVEETPLYYDKRILFRRNKSIHIFSIFWLGN